MRIWHIGASPYPLKTDGLNNTVWLVAQQQALMGHQVALLLSSSSDETAQAIAKETGLELIEIPMNQWRYDPKCIEELLLSQPPDIVHMHNVFLPNQATLAMKLAQKKIPYIITPHGGLNFRRGRVKKTLYSWFVERFRFSSAAAVTVVTPKEAEPVRALNPGYRGIVQWVANPINTDGLETQGWKGNTRVRRLVYLGRFDVLHKGIDILIDIARLLPDVEIHLHGTKDSKTERWLQSLQFNLPPNVHFKDPVFGADKTKVLAEASLYIQTSRWEVFGISIAEAMYLGLPCAIADTLNFAELFQQQDLGLVLPSNPESAAAHLLEVLSQPNRLHDWSEKAKKFAQKHFLPHEIASQYINLYQKILRV